MAGYSVLGPSTESGEVVDFQQCNRQCRWKYGFFDRAITGVRVGYFGNRNSWGQHCTCYKSGKQLGEDAGVPHVSTKSWDTADFWCGPGDGSGFVTKLVCARDGHGMKTMTRDEASSEGREVLHCGKCSACSHPDDIKVLFDTRKSITADMTKCAADFAKPNLLGGHQNLDKLVECLHKAKITFNNTRRFNDGTNGGNGPTCMECWTDNIMCDASQCSTNPSCIKKFFDPSNNGAFEGCLKCDETHCGAEFIKCAGANRRSSGIESDIARVGEQVCPVGVYFYCSECYKHCPQGNAACKAECDKAPVCHRLDQTNDQTRDKAGLV
jgi:hypothetical protein